MSNIKFLIKVYQKLYIRHFIYKSNMDTSRLSYITESNVNILEKLNIEIDDLNNIIESLDGDEYIDTRENLNIINMSKIKQFNNILSEVFKKTEMEDNYKNDGSISKFFKSMFNFSYREYARFRQSETKIRATVKADTKTNEGQKQDLYRQLDEIKGDIQRFRTISERTDKAAGGLLSGAPEETLGTLRGVDMAGLSNLIEQVKTIEILSSSTNVDKIHKGIYIARVSLKNTLSNIEKASNHYGLKIPTEEGESK